MPASVTELKNRHAELAKIDELENSYRCMARLLEPTADSDTASVNTYIRLLQGVERCIKLRIALMREVKPETDGQDALSDFIKVDLERLSDGALREVRAALIQPKSISNQVKQRKEGDESKLKMNKSP